MSRERKPPASLSLDLDNKWSYMKTHGDAGWDAFPTYLPLVVPRVLEVLRRRGLTITFFIVGQDAARAENYSALRSLATAGHEIGNHSFKHEPWLHLYSEPEIEDELIRADLGAETAGRIVAELRYGRFNTAISADEIKEVVAGEVEKALADVAQPLVIDPAKRPFVILVAGVNGSGKTTTIGKLAARLRNDGRSVMLAAGDTFRAAAIEQLKIWAERLQ